MKNSTDNFQLLLFTADPHFIKQASQAGIHGFIVDWEAKNKQTRQAGFDTQINHDTLVDLERVRANTERLVLCRINGFGKWTENEIDLAISAGADEIFLPMVRTTEEIQRTLDMIRGRCRLGILVETLDALNNIQKLAGLPLSRVYVGLNDLAIERHLKNIFISLTDGTIDAIRTHFKQPFGFGGLTLPELGSPIPCRLLIAEMARLNSDFTFLRRSFWRDIQGRDMNIEVPRILQTLADAHQRPAQQVHAEQQELIALVSQWEKGFQVVKNG